MQNQTEALAKPIDDAEYATRNVRPEFKAYYMAIHLIGENVIVQSHGRWIEELSPDGYEQKLSRTSKRCSVCGWTNACRYRYCPNCGAKMSA